MAEAIVSPGVFQRENDISFINPAPVSVGAAIIGPTVKGPVEDPTVVTSYGSYQRLLVMYLIMERAVEMSTLHLWL